MAPKAKRARVAVSEAALSEAALAYLNRFDASRKKLAEHLERWVLAHGEPPDPEPARPLIEALLTRYEASGLIDDRRTAEAALERLRARGTSGRAIRFRLAGRGVDAGSIATAFERERTETAEPELQAARAFARRRRLGSFRPEAERAEHRRRDLAALARAGFDFDTAIRALGGGEDEF